MADDPWADSPEGKNVDKKASAGNPGGSDDDWASTMAEQNSNTASFAELGRGTADEEGSRNLNFLLDIPLEVTVELGRSSMIINDMLQLTQGSVVELTKTAGEPVDIFVNHKLLGKGEVIVVNDRFGVRITEIISPAERVENMA
jgi:flagellar motor switch protein FliN/FliY